MYSTILAQCTQNQTNCFLTLNKYMQIDTNDNSCDPSIFFHIIAMSVSTESIFIRIYRIDALARILFKSG